MAKRPNPRNRERQAGRDAAARRAAERSERRRRLIAIAAVVVVLLAVIGTIVAAANDKGDQTSTPPATTTTTGLGDGPTTVPPGPTVSVEPPAAGAQITGPTPCPAEDGSSPRTTLFAQAPPTCIDPAMTYDAVITTSVGEIKVFLNTQLAPRAVNNFVVLARYHYYDGTPFVLITPQKTAQVGSDFPMPDGQRTPGYTLPGDYPKGGTIFPTGTIMMVNESGDSFGGAFQLALGDKAADLPATTTAFGLTLDGSDTLVAIGRAGTQDGTPTQVISIKSVRIELAPTTTTTTG